MARSVLVVGDPEPARPCDLPLAELVARTCADAGAPVDGSDGPTLLIDARWAALSARSLQQLLQAGPGARLRSSHGPVVAKVLDSRAGAPAHVDRWEAVDPDGGDGSAEASPVPPEEDVYVDGPGSIDGVERAWMSGRLAALAAEGVRVIRPDRIWIGADVRVEAGAVLWPDIVLRGRTVIAAGAEVRPGCWVEDTTVGPRSVLKPHTVASGATVGPDCAVGPMAHLREGAVLEEGVKVGNFVEVKKTVLRAGAKASHLTYLGDAEVGADANIGAGTITCNYDGFGKYRTTIGAGAFIGSNSSLVAPVEIGDGAIVGAGSVIASDVPADALALERSPQAIREGKAPKIRERSRQRAEAQRRSRSEDG